MIRRVVGSPAIQAAAVYAVGGLFFAIGNLMLARVLLPADFGVVALVLAIAQISTALGPLGADTIVIRYPVDPSSGLLRQIVASSVGISVAISLLVWWLYDLSVAAVILMTVISASSGINSSASAFFRSRQRYGVALGLTQGQNIVIALAAMIAWIAGTDRLILPLSILLGAYALSMVGGWFGAFALQRRAESIPLDAFPWAEGRTIVFTTVAFVFLIQIERLAIPPLLGKEALATFAVLAAIAGSPFRVLQMGVGYTMLPQLRAAAGRKEVVSIIKSEARIAAGLIAVSCLVIWFIAQLIVDGFLGGKYEITDLMLIAAMVSGTGKVLTAFGRATVMALGGQADLAYLRNGAWIAVAIAVAGAIVGAAQGLAGILFGIAAGWIFYSILALIRSRSVFFQKFA